MGLEQFIEQLGPDPEIRYPEPGHDRGEINQSTPRREINDTQSPNRPETPGDRGHDAFAIVHQQEVRAQRDAQPDRGLFTSVETWDE